MGAEMKVCRRCGIVLANEATIAMGICGSCLLRLENRPAIFPRPRYGVTATEHPQVPEMP